MRIVSLELQISSEHLNLYLGNTLQQYRLVVSMHSVYLAVTEYRGYFKGRFWHSVLLLFYFAVIYLPALKRVTHLWLTQMVFYRFYIPEIIRLSNEVETNPGPVKNDFDVSKTICAPYSQSSILFGENRGKQCVANS